MRVQYVAAILATLVMAVSVTAAPSAVVATVEGEQYAAHLFGGTAGGHAVRMDSSPAVERFRLIVSGDRVRAELLTRVGIFDSSAVLLAKRGADEVTVIDAARGTYFKTSYDEINRAQWRSVDALRDVIVSPRASADEHHHTFTFETQLRADNSHLLRYIYDVDASSREDAALMPARRLFDVLMRQDVTVLPARYRGTADVFPRGFPVAQVITPTVSMISSGHVFPMTQKSHRTFRVSAAEPYAASEVEFSVPHDFVAAHDPFAK